MGLLSGLIGTVTNAVGTNENAQAQAAKSDMAAAIQRAQLERQDQQDQITQAVQAREAQSQVLKDQLTGAQIKNVGSETTLHERQAAQPLAPVLGTPEYLHAESALADARASAEERHRKPEATPKDQVIYTTDPKTGQPVVSFANPVTHQVTQTQVEKRAPVKAMDATSKMAQDHYGRAKVASDALDKFGGTIASHNQISNAIMGMIPGTDLQQANQAGEEFVTLMAPILNKGRTTHVEIEQVRKSYVPLASDSKETVAQKAAARKALLQQYAPQINAAQHNSAPASGADPLDKYELQ